jgi:hypothetical protein
MTYKKAFKYWLKLDQHNIPAIMVKRGNRYHVKKLTHNDMGLLAMKKWDAKYGFGNKHKKEQES